MEHSDYFFIPFIGAVCSHWVLFMSGIVSILIGIWERCHKRSVTTKAFWAVGIICLFVACFFAWKEERQAVNAVRKQLRSEQAQFEGKCAYLMYDPHPSETWMFFAVELRNFGAPSIVSPWQLRIESKVLNLEIPLPDVIPEGYTIVHPNRQKITFLGGTNSFCVTTANQEISTGRPARGWLMFRLPGINARFLHDIGPVCTIIGSDFWGKKFIIPAHGGDPADPSFTIPEVEHFQ